MSKDYLGQAGKFMQAEADKKTEPKQKTSAGTRKPRKMGTIEDGQLKMADAGNIPLGYELKPESKSKRLNLLIRPTVYEALKNKAKAEGVSANEYINNLILKDIEG